MNRKGAEAIGEFTLTVGKIFLAVFIIVAIVASFYKIANYYSTSVDEKNAKSLIESITGKINNLEVGEENTFLFQGIEGWYLVGWSKDDSDGPDKCFFSSCLCVCPNPDAESCQNSGICNSIDQEKVEVDSFTTLKYFISEIVGGINNDINASCISISDVLIDIKISKSADSVKVYHDYGFIEDKLYINPFKKNEENAKNLAFKLNKCEEIYSEPSRIS